MIIFGTPKLQFISNTLQQVIIN